MVLYKNNRGVKQVNININYNNIPFYLCGKFRYIKSHFLILAISFLKRLSVVFQSLPLSIRLFFGQ